MTAITKTWVSIADSQTDPDSPIDAALITGLRDDLEHLKEWIGASYTAGAVQNHNHDGSNSASIEIGPNWLRNGGFSNGTTGWTATAYTGGTVATASSNETEGAAGAVITSTVAANGGGKLESNEFIPVVAGQTRQFMMTIKASGATVPIKAEVLWFDDAQASISNSTIVSVTTTSPTTDRLVVRRIAAPSTAKYCKVRLELPTGAGGTGSVYFDGVIVTTPQMLGGMQVFTASGTFGDSSDEVWGDVYVRVVGGGGAGGGTSIGAGSGGGAGGGGGGCAEGWVTVSSAVTVTVGPGGTGVSAGTGNTGSSSSFAASATLSATGGTGGQPNGSVTVYGGDGGIGSGGTLKIAGSCGTHNPEPTVSSSTGGGGSVFGGGALGLRGVSTNGNAGRCYGDGGGGASDGSGGANRTGGAGAAGVVIVRW